MTFAGKELHLYMERRPPDADANVLTLSDLKREGPLRFLTRRLFRFSSVVLHGGGPIPRPALTLAVSRCLTVGKLYRSTPDGGRERVSWACIIGRFAGWLRDGLALPSQLSRLRASLGGSGVAAPRPHLSATAKDVVVISASLTLRQAVGGMLAHQQGVLKALHACGLRPHFYTTAHDFPPESGCEVHPLTPPRRYWDFPEIPWLMMSDSVVAQVLAERGEDKPRFVYERHAVYGRAGWMLARRWGVPFVLEYNGSEPWMACHWGGGLKYESLAEQLERVSLQRADVVVAVSDALARDAIARGARAEAVVSVANGVDVDRFTPEVQVDSTRAGLGLGERLVIGHCGTFGPWHGASVLARAYVKLLSDHPQARDTSCLVMMGDGECLEDVRDILRALPAETYRLTGMIDAQEMPRFLAACDILVSPQVPDESTGGFFGSPTKLFEYMAMGRPVVASKVGQLAEVIRDGENGVLVSPNDAEALAEALRALSGDPGKRRALGKQARADAVSRHGWSRHVERILDHLDTVCGKGKG